VSGEGADEILVLYFAPVEDFQETIERVKNYSQLIYYEQIKQ
jgi:hypothetical protein